MFSEDSPKVWLSVRGGEGICAPEENEDFGFSEEAQHQVWTCMWTMSDPAYSDALTKPGGLYFTDTKL